MELHLPLFIYLYSYIYTSAVIAVQSGEVKVVIIVNCLQPTLRTYLLLVADWLEVQQLLRCHGNRINRRRDSLAIRSLSDFYICIIQRFIVYAFFYVYCNFVLTAPLLMSHTLYFVHWIQHSWERRQMRVKIDDLFTYASLPAQHLRPSGLSSCRPHSLELSPAFYPGPDHQCRLFQTFV